MKLNVILFSLVFLALSVDRGIEGKEEPEKCQCVVKSGCSDLVKYGTMGAAAVGAVAAAPYALGAAGFGAAGIATNSFGSFLMGLYGGAVPAGSVLSGLQAAGAAGLSASAKAALGSAGSWIGKQVTSSLCGEEECEC